MLVRALTFSLPLWDELLSGVAQPWHGDVEQACTRVERLTAPPLSAMFLSQATMALVRASGP